MRSAQNKFKIMHIEHNHKPVKLKEANEIKKHNFHFDLTLSV